MDLLNLNILLVYQHFVAEAEKKKQFKSHKPTKKLNQIISIILLIINTQTNNPTETILRNF